MSAKNQDITIDVEGITKVANSMEKLAGLIGAPIKWVATDQLRLAVEHSIQRAPPKSYSAGRKKVERTMAGLYLNMNRGDIVDEWEAKSGGKTYPARIFKTEKGGVFAIPIELYSPGGDGMKEFHARFRKHGKRPAVAPIGKWLTVGKMAVKRAPLKSMRDSILALVGTLKASWIPALEKLSAFVGAGVNLPSWITRVGRKYGAHSLSTMNDRGDGYVSATNQSRAAQKQLKASMPFIIRRRQNDIDKALANDKRLKQLQDRFNAGQL